MIKAIKIRLVPNKEQEILMFKSYGKTIYYTSLMPQQEYVDLYD
jgi:Helix-turn-helix domain.